MKKVQYILGVDLEGINRDLLYTGLDLKVDRIIEIGAVLWDYKFNLPVQFISELIDEKDHLSISEEVEEITGINDDILSEWGLKDEQIKETLLKFTSLAKKADFLMAHNGRNYDRPMLEAIYKRFDLELPSKPWIDTSIDIEFPKKIKKKSLAALEHVHSFINPFPHRAMTDVLSMFKVAHFYNMERIAQLATSNKVRMIAKLKAPNWKDPQEVDKFNRLKNKVANAEFRWNPHRKIWSKETSQLLIDEGLIKYDFEWSIQV